MNKLKKVLSVNILPVILIGLAIVASFYAAFKHVHPPIMHVAESKVKGKLSPVVRLTDQVGRTFCTGVVVSPHTIITAGHCVVEGMAFGIILPKDEIYIRDTDSTPPGIKASIVSIRPQMDTATLAGDFSSFESRSVITDVEKLVSVGQPDAMFISCGFPLGQALYCNKLKYVGRINFMWLMKGVLLPGMSGGPTMLDDGTVIAINDAVQDDFAIIVPVYQTPVEK